MDGISKRESECDNHWKFHKILEIPEKMPGAWETFSPLLSNTVKWHIQVVYVTRKSAIRGGILMSELFLRARKKWWKIISKEYTWCTEIVKIKLARNVAKFNLLQDSYYIKNVYLVQ